MLIRKKHLIIVIAIAATTLLLTDSRFQFFVLALHYEPTMADSSLKDTTVTNVSATTDRSGREATLLSAFFGLDNHLPYLANLGICNGAARLDGMPVVFSHELDLESLQAGDFEVHSENGQTGSIKCVTLAPADNLGEWRTVLIVGELGSQEDEPMTVRIVGNLLSKDHSVNFIETEVGVVPLDDGPSLVFAELVPPREWELGRQATKLPWGGGSSCPLGSQQIIRVTWEGGVTLPGGAEVDDSIRRAYKVLVSDDQGVTREIQPFALGDLGDGDNNHLLCLDVRDPAKEISFPRGLLTDPNEDFNFETGHLVLN